MEYYCEGEEIMPSRTIRTYLEEVGDDLKKQR